MQAAILVRQHRQRRVVAHRADGFLAVLGHGLEDQLHVFHRQIETGLAAGQRLARDGGGLGAVADQAVELGGLFQPVFIGLLGRQHVLQLAVLEEAAGLEVDGDHLARADAALLDHGALGDADHAGLGTDDQQSVGGDRVAHRTQSVAVHAGDDPASIGRAHRGRAVPRLHHAVAIAEEGLVGVGHGVVVGQALGDQHRLDHRRVAPGAHQQLEHIVERGAVRTARLHHRLDVGDMVVEQFMGEPRLVRLHPVEIAAQRVDLAVVGQHAEGLGQAPGREGVGRIALVIDGEGRGESVVQQVGIEHRDLLGQEHALVDHRAAGQRADVEIADMLGQHLGLDAPADDIEVGLEAALVEALGVGHHDLLDLGAGGVGLLADHRDVHRHLAPAIDGVAEGQDLAFHDRAAALLGGQIRLGQEAHADGQAPGHRFAALAADMVAEEILRDFDMDAGAVAGFPIRVDRAAVIDDLQGLDAGHNHLAAGLAVQRRDQADAAGIVRGGVDAGILEDLLVGQILGDELISAGHAAPTFSEEIWPGSASMRRSQAETAGKSDRSIPASGATPT